MTYKSSRVDIIICTACGGQGVRKHEHCIDYHRREYEYIPYKCKTCEGSGRLYQTITLEPYVPVESKE